MNPFSLIIPIVALGLMIGSQTANAQNPQNADLHPPYLSDEAMMEEHILEEGEEGEDADADEEEEHVNRRDVGEADDDRGSEDSPIAARRQALR